jgi:hypothetical protein
MPHLLPNRPRVDIYENPSEHYGVPAARTKASFEALRPHYYMETAPNGGGPTLKVGYGNADRYRGTMCNKVTCFVSGTADSDGEPLGAMSMCLSSDYENGRGDELGWDEDEDEVRVSASASSGGTGRSSQSSGSSGQGRRPRARVGGARSRSASSSFGKPLPHQVHVAGDIELWRTNSPLSSDSNHSTSFSPRLGLRATPMATATPTSTTASVNGNGSRRTPRKNSREMGRMAAAKDSVEVDDVEHDNTRVEEILKNMQ